MQNIAKWPIQPLAMEASAPKYIRRQDYASPDWLIPKTHLDVQIFDEYACSIITLTLESAGQTVRPLSLQGEHLEFISAVCDGVAVDSQHITLNDDGLVITGLPPRCTLAITSRLNPYTNTALEGLYASGDMLCTQCEPEGFRRIAYFADRPDVMSIFTTRIEADLKYPNLLSNGNLKTTETLDNGRHVAIWHDPHPKPSYLFALVAGDLACVKDRFIRASGQLVELHIYVEHGNEHLTDHAMDSLKASMKWDEDVYGLEYDLDLFQIVAVSHFNMGAMENKGLNIFNSKFVLADEQTATDDDLARVESIVAHEYFHNWTGNRVTCRDWFQLTLKEGLTVFRDQCFSADMHDEGVKRAEDINILRNVQFSEDASPTAHPIRPEQYAEINNFYTPTVYEKGAEIIRMMHQVLGPQAYRKGIDIYFERHDGQAVTCDDFISALDDASDADIRQFEIWYRQAGTPELAARREGKDRLSFSQSLAPTAANTSTDPMPIPVKLGLVGKQGEAIAFSVDGGTSDTEHLVMVDSAHKTVSLSSDNADIADAVPSILRGFSAPVRLVHDLERDEIAHLASFDSDKVNRYEAFQTLYQQAISARLAVACDEQLEDILGQAIARLLDDSQLDDDFKALSLSLPSQAETEQAASMHGYADPVAIYWARMALGAALGRQAAEWITDFISDDTHQDASGSRHLLGRALSLGVLAGDEGCIHRAEMLAVHDNMTVSMAALRALNNSDNHAGERALSKFHDRWQDQPLVMEKWLSLKASSAHSSDIDAVRRLMAHPAFDIGNPNKVRAVLGSFCSANPVHFHHASGSGYRFIAEQMLVLDARNPQIAARLGISLTRYAHYQPERQKLMCDMLQMLNRADLSRDLREMVSKGLTAL